MHVVVVHYRLPEKRLSDFFDWNNKVFQDNGINVVVVSDIKKPMPFYAKCLVYPPLEMFSITKTANAGIRKAGAGVIVKTDIDCIFSQAAVNACKLVSKGFGVGLSYNMVNGPNDKHGTLWRGTVGTVAMVFDDWSKINGYDERMEGYGYDDGDLVVRAEGAGIRINRPVVDFKHVAHDTGADQSDPRNRKDYWNRDGFNPLHREENGKFTQTPYNNKNWGKIPSFTPVQ